MNVEKLDKTIEVIEDLIMASAKGSMPGLPIPRLADEISALASLLQARALIEGLVNK